MIELNQLQHLVAIVEAGTISKASEILLISQPALTRSIQKLEDELGLKLFDHKKNKIIINENGELAVKYAQKLLNDANNMVLQLQLNDQKNRLISIGSCAPAPLWGTHYVLSHLYPENKIKADINSNQEKLLLGLKNNLYSIILLTQPIKEKGYICIPLFEENLYLSVPPAHPLALNPQVSFEDLNGESVLLLSRIGFWNELCIQKLPQSHLLIQEDKKIFKELVRASALPNFKSNITQVKDQSENNRITIPISDIEATVTYYACFHQDQRKLFSPLKNEMKNLNWINVPEITV